MVDDDPFVTQRGVPPSVTSELDAAGFTDASEIGRGGFGVVYRCTEDVLDRTVAVKVLTAAFDEENRERFVREQQAMGRLTGHPNIVNVLQVGTTAGGHPYLVMPYCEHGSLDVRIRDHGPLPLEETLQLGVKLAGAVESAHRLGILHRDIKPANVLLTDYGEPALSDFGIAHVSGGFQTTAGAFTATPAFTAPEILSGEPPTPAADVYGIGATLFCALTGHAAFARRSGEQVVAQFLRITNEPIPNLRELDIPDDVAAAIENAMSSDPGNRQSAARLGESLREIQFRHGLPVDDMALRNRAPSKSDAAARERPPDTGSSTLGTRGNLPSELTSFINRRTELAEAKELLSTARLVTLTGIGGVGKTRLAIRIATRVQRAFRDGTWLIELGELHDESLLAHVVATTLGIRAFSPDPAETILAEYLATRQVLLVLDNCEHVIDAVAELTATLLRGCPEVRILATSREPLGIGGEATLRVPSLDVPSPDRDLTLDGLPSFAAVTLFAERAATVLPGFAVTEENMAAVAGICHRLEGLPLPIELAAARLQALSPQQILQRLTDRYTLLTRGSRIAPSRQQTLRLCIDWSYDLCTPEEQQLWARLSVFAGTFELSAVEHVCGEGLAPGALLDLIASLVEKSILIREESRYRILETLREYGLEKLEERGEHSRIRLRHRDWYVRLAVRAEEEFIGPRQLDWMTRLKLDQQNLRAALNTCVTVTGKAVAGLRLSGALYPFWLASGWVDEGALWIARALAVDGVPRGREWIKATSLGIVLIGIQGHGDRADSLLEQAREAVAEVDDTVSDVLVLYAAGNRAMYTDMSAAAAYFDEALALCPPDATLLRTINLIGAELAHGLLGHAERAAECLDQVLRITESRGELVFRALSLRNQGVSVWSADRVRAALLLKQALTLLRTIGDAYGSAPALECMAWIAASDGDATRCAVLFGAAQAMRHVGRLPQMALPTMQANHDEFEPRVRRTLGSKAYDAAYRKGLSMSFGKAVAYALSESSEPARPSTDASAVSLTRRETQVADLVAQGLTNSAIAAKLVISRRTAEGHVEHILTKLGFTSRAQVAAWVVERNRG
ncbi:protein kinase [Rhodococcus sp. NPDC127528]|uniref:protein kinase domain-containing protein n=1 Tax=unclassified Rhodococcus (in: high G+C Gram-positive bacteria) TaxID=192944 RepID=UPI0036271FDB